MHVAGGISEKPRRGTPGLSVIPSVQPPSTAMRLTNGTGDADYFGLPDMSPMPVIGPLPSMFPWAEPTDMPA